MHSDQVPLPCPFCGGTKLHIFKEHWPFRTWHVRHCCSILYTDHDIHMTGPSREAAIAQWNRRSDATTAAQRQGDQ